jgi:chromosome segregation ATPase
MTAEKAAAEQELGRIKAATHGASPQAAGTAGTAGLEEIFAERDQLKEKNEKLKIMCKKYVAKLKQLESGAGAGGQSPVLLTSRSSEEEERLREENDQLRAELAALNEVVTANNTALAGLEANFADSLGQLDAAAATVERLTAEAAEREAALTAKDDLVRELKAKLEAAPENITVPVALMEEDAVEAAARAKHELAAIKEKCKKLIVKVKQQDELLKRERLKSVASSSGAEDDNAAAHDNSAAEKAALVAEKAAVVAEKDALAAETASLTAQLATTQVGLADTREENSRLQQRLLEMEAAVGRQTASLEAKVEQLVAERTAAYEAQVELKAELQTLRQERQAAVAGRQAAEAELRRLREANLVRQMQASSMLQVFIHRAGLVFGSFADPDF